MRNKNIPLLLITVLVTIGSSFSMGLRFERPRIEGYHSVDDDSYASSPLTQKHPIALKLQTSLFKDTALIDFEKRQISFQRYDSIGFIVWEYHYDELDDYLLARANYGLYHSWYLASLSSIKNSDQGRASNMKLEWELPVQYPGWAQRVLGKDPPRLTIEGALKIKVGWENQSIDRQNGSLDAGSNSGGFNFDQTSRFSIRGSVGRLININISANSEDGFNMQDPLKNFKLEYKESTPGELEDEVVQEVIAGYTGFEMPGTSLSGYSESHEGLFGIKIKSKIGPLMLTTIASNENGESQKITRSGRTSGGVTSITQLDYLENKYFFLDSVYRDAYNKKYWDKNSPSPSEIAELQVWRMVDRTRITNSNNELRTIRRARINNNKDGYYFELLGENKHYKVNGKEGWFRFFDSVSVQTDDIIAIYLRTKDQNKAIDKGDTTFDTTATASDEKHPLMKNLYVIKNASPPDSAKADSTYDLMWRNVYRLPDFQDLSSFKLRMYVKSVDAESTTTIEGTGESFSDVLKLTKKGVTLTDQPYVYNVEDRVLIIPPFDSSYRGNEPFANPALGRYKDSVLYNFNRLSSKFQTDYNASFHIEMTGSSKQTTFDLGYGVMAGTDIVKSSVGRLERNVDYTVNYEMGTLELTSARAKAADNIEIEYQRDALFVPERKTFLGARGELKLPFLGENSFIGSSILFQNASSGKEIPRLGQEPFSKLLFDINTKIDLEPEWMTQLVNLIPLIKTSAQSSAQFDLEVAHSRMNPNTDNQAYIDDFEQSKLIYDLGTSASSWHPASPPFKDPQTEMLTNPVAWDFYWFSPIAEDDANKVLRNKIWQPDLNQTYSSSDLYETILRLHCTPSSELYKGRYKKAWAGIMTSIPNSFSDLSRSRYLEFIAKPGKLNGKLIIQLGEMREALPLNGKAPDGLPHYEDTSRIRYNYYDTTLDKGLDGLWDKDEKYYIPNEINSDWDIPLGYGDSTLKYPLDPSKDNFRKYDNQHPKEFKYANGTQRDGYLSSEDINNDGTVQRSMMEKYFSDTIDLSAANIDIIDKSAKLIDTSGWYLYRIPLQEDMPGYHFKRVNDPTWKRITMARLIWTDFDETSLTQEHQLLLGQIQIVGNQWEAVPIREDSTLHAKDSTSKDTIVSFLTNNIEPSVIGTANNKKYTDELLFSRGNVKRIKDETGHYRDEQSLRLNYKNLEKGKSAIVRRNMSYQALNLASYDTMTLVVHAEQEDVDSDSGVQFVFRFGSDDSTYYEYHTVLKPKWDNFIQIDLRQFSKMKLDFTTDNEGKEIDTTIGNLSICAPKGRQPNFSNIIWLGLGVTRDSSRGPDAVSGEIWVDELKVKGIKALNGWAARANISTKFADFATLSAGLSYQDGDFRSMTDNNIAPGQSQMTGTVNANVNLDKFLPQEWGVQLPVGASVSGSLTRPQLKPTTDIYVNDSITHKPDNLAQMAEDFSNIAFGTKLKSDTTESEHFEQQSVNQTLYSNYQKNAKSDNPFVNLTADRIDIEAKYSLTATKTMKGRIKSDSPADYYSVDTNENYSSSLKYDLSPRDPPSWTKGKLFGEKPFEWIPGQFKNAEYSLLPERISFDVYDINYGTDRGIDTKVINSGKSLRTFDLRHGFQLDYAPISSLLNFNYTLGINRDLKNVDPSQEKIGTLISENILAKDSIFGNYWLLYGEKSRTQHAGVKISPQFFNWLTHNIDYGVDYTGSLGKGRGNDSTIYLTNGIKGNFSLNSTFDANNLLTDLSKLGMIGGFFDILNKGFDKIGLKNVSFTYSAISELQNKNMSDAYLNKSLNGKADFYAYQFGAKPVWDIITGTMQDSAFGGMDYRKKGNKEDENNGNDDSRMVNQSYRLSTSLHLPEPIDININNISFGWSYRYGFYPTSSRNDTTRVLPELSVGASSDMLQKFPLITGFVQQVSLSSNFTYKSAYTHSGSNTNEDTTNLFDMQPVIGVNGTVKKWPIRFEYHRNYTRDERLANGSSLTKKWSDNIDLTYEVEATSKLSELKFLSWTIPVKGRTSMGAKFTIDNSKTVTKEEVTNFENNVTLTPHLSYIFTDNVTGTLEYIFSKKSISGVTTNSNNVGLTADITF